MTEISSQFGPIDPDRTTENRVVSAVAHEPWEGLSIQVMCRGPWGSSLIVPLQTGTDIVIGRAIDCEIQIGDPLVSRAHARVRSGDQVDIVDLGSANGTSVGGRKLAPHEPHVLAPGDLITVGTTHLVLLPDAREEANVSVRAAPPSRRSLGPLDIPVDGALARILPLLERYATGPIAILVLGETGVGKDVVASLVHRLSPRAENPLVCLNCAALPEHLLESELFGYERGAFTGANQAKAGILESAAGGTVFLDEVAEMPPSIQAKLLRVLDHHEVLRLGATRPRPIDVRFVAATNRDLEAEVARGAFRQDLLFRLNAATVVVPPLRERAHEIPALARSFAAAACHAQGRAAVAQITPAVMDILLQYSWPGNVRELKNVIDRAVLLATEGMIDVAHIDSERMLKSRVVIAEAPVTLRPVDGDLEQARILHALEQCGGNQTKTAKVLGMSRRTLVARLSAYGLTRKRSREDQ